MNPPLLLSSSVARVNVLAERLKTPRQISLRAVSSTSYVIVAPSAYTSRNRKYAVSALGGSGCSWYGPVPAVYVTSATAPDGAPGSILFMDFYGVVVPKLRLATGAPTVYGKFALVPFGAKTTLKVPLLPAGAPLAENCSTPPAPVVTAGLVVADICGEPLMTPLKTFHGPARGLHDWS